LGNIHREKDFDCDACGAAKQKRASHHPSASTAKQACELFHTDWMCPTENGLMTNERSYVLTILDDYSRYSEVRMLGTKSAVATALLGSTRRMERQTGNKVKSIRFDRGREFYQLKEWMMQEGIVPQPVPAYTPEANGRAERLNRTLLERTRALLHYFDLPSPLWHYAIRVAAYTRNMVPSVDLDITPYELFFQVTPDVSPFLGVILEFLFSMWEV
jgi:transposase InsO family protein